MKTNPNETERFGISPAQTDALFARTTAQAIADREARLRAAEWPGEVEQLLTSLTHELVALRKRVDAVETEIGAGRG